MGQGVTGLKPGDRVAYQGGVGAYAEKRLIQADRVVKMPDGLDPQVAAAAFLKGLTVQCLMRRTFKVEKGQTILWHAAAGGVGTIAAQWVSGAWRDRDRHGWRRQQDRASPRPMAAPTSSTTAPRISSPGSRRSPAARGSTASTTSVGKDTFPASLDCLKPLGMFASFGQSSGLPPPFTLAMLQQKGALFATRPTITVYLAKRPDLEASAAELFEALKSGMVKIAVNQELPLKEAAEAHRALEARETTGATVLMP